jgi:hypothetical protein
VYNGVTAPIGVAAGGSYSFVVTGMLTTVYVDPISDVDTGAACQVAFGGAPVITSGGYGFHSPLMSITLGAGCGVGDSATLFDSGGTLSRTLQHGGMKILSHC